MADGTGISWTDATWNPVRGCSRVSEGCRNCYAERVAARFSGPGQPYEGLIADRRGGVGRAPSPRWNGVVRVVPEHLTDPLRWKKPRRIFVNSMSDLFHESLTNEQIAAVFGVIAAAPQHTFQILTKRAKRMREWFAWLEESVEKSAEEWAVRDCSITIDEARKDCILEYLDETATAALAGHFDTSPLGLTVGGAQWPLTNVWIGVSVENQAAADERIPDLLATPAAVRFISAEPLLGPVALREEWMLGKFIECPDENRGDEVDPCAGCPAVPNDGVRGGDYCGAIRGPRIAWLIAGCESGPGARPCEVDWLRSLRDQCAAAGVAFWLKQAGARMTPASITEGAGSKRKPGGVIELPYLDGKQHAEMPEVHRG